MGFCAISFRFVSLECHPQEGDIYHNEQGTRKDGISCHLSPLPETQLWQQQTLQSISGHRDRCDCDSASVSQRHSGRGIDRHGFALRVRRRKNMYHLLDQVPGTQPEKKRIRLSWYAILIPEKEGQRPSWIKGNAHRRDYGL